MTSLAILWGRFFVVGFPLLFLLFGGVGGLRLVLDHSETTGVIREYQPLNHRSVVVSYVVDGHDETTLEPYPGGEVPQTGSSIIVYYARSDPSNASLEQPSVVFGSGFLFMAIASAAGALVLASFVRGLRGTYRAHPHSTS